MPDEKPEEKWVLPVEIANMPWTIQYFPVNDQQRPYRVYPNGLSMMASPEDVDIWSGYESLKLLAQNLQQELQEAQQQLQQLQAEHPHKKKRS